MSAQPAAGGVRWMEMLKNGLGAPLVVLSQLLSVGVPADEVVKGMPALCVACMSGQWTHAKMLVAYGAVRISIDMLFPLCFVLSLHISMPFTFCLSL